MDSPIFPNLGLRWSNALIQVALYLPFLVIFGFYIVFGLQFYCLDQERKVFEQEKANTEQLEAVEATIQKLPVDEKYNLGAIQYQKIDLERTERYLRGQYDAYYDAGHYSMTRTLVCLYLFLAVTIGLSVFCNRRMKASLQI